MSVVSSRDGPATFAGLATTRWSFALRVWVAMMLALYVAFWLQLDGASSAATCVAILALPTRGQAFEKAAHRIGATVIGVAASIAISGLFSQTRDLLLLAFASWLAICVFVANLLDGNRAYGAVLSGYTVAIVSVAQIDSPQDVWSSGINRGAAIAVGIAAMALVNDLFAAPDVYPKVLGDVTAARRKVLDFAAVARRAGGASTETAAGLLKTLTGFHAAIAALAAESSMGRVRAAAARSTVLALVEAVLAAHAIAGVGRAGSAPPALPGPNDRSTSLLDVLDRQERLAADGLAALVEERWPARRAALPLFRSRRLAARKGLRVGIAVALSSVFFVYSSWPGTSSALLLLGVVAALSSTAPSAKGFAMGALLAMPLAVALVGIVEFLVLDGVDQFPLLCIAMGPCVVAAGLMLSSANPKLGGIGFLLLVFFPVILSPSNPQSYNPQSYLTIGVLAVTAVLLLAFWLTVLSPATEAQRQRWFLRSASDDLRAAAEGRLGRLTPAEAAYRSADRIAQLAAPGAGSDPDREAAIADAFLLAEIDGALRRARGEFTAMGSGATARAAAAQGDDALAALDPRDIRAAAARCEDAAPALPAVESAAARRAAGELLLVAVLVEEHRDDIRRLVPRSVTS